jgi:tetratricopeptide (TPR) repeat protein
LNKTAWDSDLEVLSSSAGAREILDFLDNSPEQFKSSQEALLARVAQYVQNGNETETMNVLARLESGYSQNGQVAELLAAFYSNRGDTRRAQSLLKNRIRRERSSFTAYEQLAGLYLKMGDRRKAVQVYRQSLKYSPVSPDAYHFLARLYYQLGENALALEYANAGLAYMPTLPALLNLKGAILAASGKKTEAADVLGLSIASDYNNFAAWDQLLPLKGTPPVGSLVPPTDPDSVMRAAANWKDVNGENGSVLAYVNDLFFYPSRCSRERNFIMVCVPAQNAIDTWKEYSIPYNGNYQMLNVTRAYSLAADGRETPADVSRNMAVFKSLKPGDYIVLEWVLDNYYSGDMAGHVWGDFSFDLPYPVFMSAQRLVTPASDTIGWSLLGDSVSVLRRNAGAFSVTSFVRGPYRNPQGESFMQIDPPGSRRLSYSTLGSWGDMVRWYSDLTENKIEQTSELKAVADSILAGAESDSAKVRRIHKFITGSVRYSYVPFRQSAWIPQPAREVLATRIGDCKDMASFAKSLLDYAGAGGSLVLVNTRDDNSTTPSYIGPNFNHCIVSYMLNNTRRYLDLTDNNLSARCIPRADQGALALVVEPGCDSLIRLPVDRPEDRFTSRKIDTRILTDGTIETSVRTVRTGILAGQIRSMYRFLPEKERERTLQKVLNEAFPGVRIDSVFFGPLDSLLDTLDYSYAYTAANSAQLSANTAIVPLNLPDRIDGQSYPSEEPRHYDIDMAQSWFDIGEFVMEGSLVVPAGWTPITLPPPIKYSSEYGEYSLTFSYRSDTISYVRRAKFNIVNPITAAESSKLRGFLSGIARADNVYLMFYTDGTRR